MQHELKNRAVVVKILYHELKPMDYSKLGDFVSPDLLNGLHDLVIWG